MFLSCVNNIIWCFVDKWIKKAKKNYIKCKSRSISLYLVLFDGGRVFLILIKISVSNTLL